MSSTSHNRPPPRVHEITKRDNLFQRADVLKRNREKRFQYGQFLVEGVAQITLAVEHGWKVHAFLYASRRKLSDWARQLLDSGTAAEHWELSPDLLADLSDKEETSELMAIIETRRLAPEDLEPKTSGLIVAFDRPSSPGNLGSSIRSADALGADAVIITGHAVDLYDPHVVRGSMGAVFTLPVALAASQEALKNWVIAAREKGFPYQIIGSSGKASHPLTAVDFTKPTVLVLGNETVGMSRGYWDICDATVTIPLSGALSSLNVSCAASILLYEISRQRIAASSTTPE
jgi:TrmH family RNA methyltransferase